MARGANVVTVGDVEALHSSAELPQQQSSLVPSELLLGPVRGVTVDISKGNALKRSFELPQVKMQGLITMLLTAREHTFNPLALLPSGRFRHIC